MAHFWQQLRTGAWLTSDRIRGYSLILLGFYIIAIGTWLTLSHGLIDYNGKPVGTDFSGLYAAGSLALEARAADAYDMAADYLRQQQIFGAGVTNCPWFYPPFFLLIAAPLALMPYSVALVVWQAATLAFYAGVIGAILRPARRINQVVDRLWLFPAMAFPAVFINLGHGQNGFLSAGLLGGALLMLTTRPLVSGIMFGCLAYKPQFALVIPLALLIAGQWRTIAAAATTVLVLVAATYLAFGADVWIAFAASTEIPHKLLLEQGGVGYEKLQSALAAARMWGGSVPLAYVVQGITSAVAVCGVTWVWRRSCDLDSKAAMLLIATLLASPYSLDYDLVVVAPAIAFIARSGFVGGFRDLEISILAGAWTVPLLARAVAGAAGVPLGLMALIALFVIVLRRATLNRDGFTFQRTGLAQA